MGIQVATKKRIFYRKGNPGSTLDESHISSAEYCIQEVALPLAPDILTSPHSIHINAYGVFTCAFCVCAHCVKSHINISLASSVCKNLRLSFFFIVHALDR